MCLEHLTTKKPKTAKEDIVVYKWLELCIPQNVIIAYLQEHHTDKKYVPCEVEVYENISTRSKTYKLSGVLYMNTISVYILHNDSNVGGLANDKEYKYVRFFSIAVASIKIGDVLFQNKDYIQTPYKIYPIKFDTLYETKLEKHESSINYGFHSFASLAAAKHDSGGLYEPYIFAKCIIPKGAKYYEGKFIGEKSYASDKLKYIGRCV